jgi:hypothetical protein
VPSATGLLSLLQTPGNGIRIFLSLRKSSDIRTTPRQSKSAFVPGEKNNHLRDGGKPVGRKLKMHTYWPLSYAESEPFQ